MLGVVPLNHIYGLSAILLPTLFSGNELVLHLRFDAGRVMADIAGKRISRFSGVPAMFASLVSHSAFRNSDFSSLMSWGTGGAPLPLELRQELEAVSSRGLAEGYALTETTGLATLPISSNAIDRVGQVGIPAPLTTIEVVDLTTGMELLPVGEVGEICISGPQVMKGYWNRPSDNLQAFRGGRFHTGDVGYIDARGRVTLTERKKDMLLVGAHNVYPRNIERAIQAHPDVAEVAVIGVPNKDFGQIPKAILVLKPDSAPLTHRELCLFLAKRLAAHELPGTIEIRSELPKTAMGKISKLTLMEEEVART